MVYKGRVMLYDYVLIRKEECIKREMNKFFD